MTQRKETPVAEDMAEVRDFMAKLDRRITELVERCRCAESWADELVEQFLDLMDALDALDVIRLLEQHVPDHRRFLVDELVGKIAKIREDAFLDD